MRGFGARHIKIVADLYAAQLRMCLSEFRLKFQCPIDGFACKANALIDWYPGPPGLDGVCPAEFGPAKSVARVNVEGFAEILNALRRILAGKALHKVCAQVREALGLGIVRTALDRPGYTVDRLAPHGSGLTR